MSEVISEKPVSGIEEINKTIMHGVKKIEKHVTSEMRTEIKIAIQKIIQEVVKKIMIIIYTIISQKIKIKTPYKKALVEQIRKSQC